MTDTNEEKVRSEDGNGPGVSCMGESPALSAEEFEKMAKSDSPPGVNDLAADSVPEV